MTNKEAKLLCKDMCKCFLTFATGSQAGWVWGKVWKLQRKVEGKTKIDFEDDIVFLAVLILLWNQRLMSVFPFHCVKLNLYNLQKISRNHTQHLFINRSQRTISAEACIQLGLKAKRGRGAKYRLSPLFKETSVHLKYIN